MRPLTFRAAGEADLDRLIDIHRSAFPDPRGAEPRRRNFAANPLGSLADLKVALLGDEPVAHAFLFRLEVWFGGARVKAGAIASVGVAPEARGEGLAAALLDHLHAEAEARGDAITILFPFRQGFYARHGYAPVTPARRMLVHPASVPRAWRAKHESGLVVRAARGDDTTAMIAAYERAAARATGWLARPEALWQSLLQDERRVWLVATRGGAIEGYAAWSLAQAEAHAATRLIVHEVVADRDDVRRALLGQLGAQRDQIAEIAIDVDARDPLDRALLDADRGRFGTQEVEHTLGVLSGGPMVRVVDVARACEARGYAVDGAITVAIDGTAPIHLVVERGTCKIHATAEPADIRLDRAAFASILYGALAPSDAVRLGWLTADDPSAVARADALFALPPYFAIDTF
jgi:predicted acetyltransferase